MSTQKPKKIKAVLGFDRLADGDLVTRLNAVHDGMNNNPAYPAPPIDMPTLETNITSLTAAVAAAAADGGKKTVTEKNKQRNVVIKMLDHLAHYVEVNCKDDLTTFTSSGFQAASTTRTPSQPLPQPSIAKVIQGISGQLLVAIKALHGAVSYELRWAVLGPNNTPGTFTSIHLPSSKKSPVNNLTPGTTYIFQVRGLGRLGFSDWSDPVIRMCT
jgi:hypothetical protein